MNAEDTRGRPTPMARWQKSLITLLIVGLTAALIWSNLPHDAYPSDLSLIGKGQPVLVLAYDKNYASGRNVMDLMNSVRGDYAGRMQFLVTALASPEGQAFARRYDATDGTVLLFTGDGGLAKTLNQPQTADELRQALQQAFGL
jgi:hypothetical protein